VTQLLHNRRHVESFFDIFGRGTGDLTDRLAVDRAVIGKIFPLQERYPAASDEVLILRLAAALM